MQMRHIVRSCVLVAVFAAACGGSIEAVPGGGGASEGSDYRCPDPFRALDRQPCTAEGLVCHSEGPGPCASPACTCKGGTFRCAVAPGACRDAAPSPEGSPTKGPRTAGCIEAGGECILTAGQNLNGDCPAGDVTLSASCGSPNASCCKRPAGATPGSACAGSGGACYAVCAGDIENAPTHNDCPLPSCAARRSTLAAIEHGARRRSWRRPGEPGRDHVARRSRVVGESGDARLT